MSKYELSFASKQITDAVSKALKDTALLYDRSMKEVFRDNIFEWPTGDSPRDIIDTGNLAASQDMGPLVKNSVTWNWNQDYAAYVHFGYVSRAGNSFPARPWTTIAKDRIDLPSVYGKLFQRYS